MKKAGLRRAARSQQKVTTSAAVARHLSPQKRAGKKRSADVSKKLLDMLEVIKLEISSNDGVYPYGRLSMRAVAARAGVDKSTLHTKNGKAAGDVVHKFVEEHNKPKEGETLKPSRRRTLAERLRDKTVEFETLLQQHQIRNLHLQQAKSERDEARGLVTELQSTVLELEAKLTAIARAEKQLKSSELHRKKKSSSDSTRSTRAKVLPFNRKASDGRHEPG